MTSPPPNVLFWDRVAERYAARPIKDVPAYEAMLDAVRSTLRPSDKALELGCGTGTTAIRLAPCVAQLTASDLSRRMIGIAGQKPAPLNLTFRHADAADRIEGAPFDAVMAFNLLHLVPDLDAALAAVGSQLKHSGRFISKTPCLGEVSLPLRLVVRAMRGVGLAPPVAFLTAPALRQAFAKAGFEIVEHRVFGKTRAIHYFVALKS